MPLLSKQGAGSLLGWLLHVLERRFATVSKATFMVAPRSKQRSGTGKPIPASEQSLLSQKEHL